MSQHVFHPDGPIQLVMNPLAVKKYDGGMAKNQDAPFQEGNCVRTFGRSNHQLSISGTAKHRGLCEFESSQLADAVLVEPVSTP